MTFCLLKFLTSNSEQANKKTRFSVTETGLESNEGNINL